MQDSMPKLLNINPELHPQVDATMSTGGAAKLVRVPPIEILTNSTPSVPNSNDLEHRCRYTKSRNKKAANVIAAGSVMSDPSSGVKPRVKKYSGGAPLMPSKRFNIFAAACSSCVEKCNMGLLPATIMMAKTNKGSVKLREFK